VYDKPAETHQFGVVGQATVTAGVLAGNHLQFARFLGVAPSLALPLSSFPLRLLSLVQFASLGANVGPSRAPMPPFPLRVERERERKSRKER